MNILELFAGSRSFTKVAQRSGHKTFTTDIKGFDSIDYIIDIMDFNVKKIPFKPDIIWASPPCTTYSIAAISHHRPHNKPLSEFAIKSDNMVKKTLEIIKELNPTYWFVENPRGMLRKQSFMLGLPQVTVWYCQYGDTRAKPTDIFSNNIRSIFNTNGWNPKPECFNGNKNCHHQPAPRGSRTGTQGLQNAYEKSKVPEQLCEEILKSIK